MHKVNSKTVNESTHIKIYVQQFMSIICHFCHSFQIIYQSIFYNCSNTVNDWFICNVNKQGLIL